MDGRNKKLSPVEIRNLLLAEEGLEVRKIGEPRYPKSARRQKTQLMNGILQSFPFPKAQQELLKALNSKGLLDVHQIAQETGSKAPDALIRDTRKMIKSTQYLRDILAIGIFHRGRRWLYYLKFMDPSATSNSHQS